ncbi:Uncharacterised protein [Mycobacteroides abscessus subsp. abscessus]|nr:Uncharacterised protein [Mycobacteroides abscessus subsp. abscessus]
MNIINVDVTDYLKFLIPLPSDAAVNRGCVWALTIILGVAAFGAVGFLLAKAVTLRTLMPAFLVVSGLFAFCGEWAGDIVYNIYYTSDAPIVLYSAFGRHIPLWILFLWLAYVPLSTYVAYRLIANRAPIGTLAIFALGAGIIEIASEMLMCHFGAMNYYGHYAKFLGVPVTSIFQNGFMYLPMGVLIAVWATKKSEIQWTLLPIFLAFRFGYVAIVTLPNYLIIGNGDFPPAVAWTVGLILSAAEIAFAVRVVKQHYQRLNAAETGVRSDGQAIGTSDTRCTSSKLTPS